MRFFHKLLVAAGLVMLVAGAFGLWAWKGGASGVATSATEGSDPALADPHSRLVPVVDLAKPVGWKANEAPIAAKGLSVMRFADGLEHPRTMLTLDNGDVLVALTRSPGINTDTGITGFFARTFKRSVGAGTNSPNQIVLLRDSDGDGRAEQRFVLRADDMHSPSGMAAGNGKLYIANHDAVLAFDFTPGMTKLTGKPDKIMDLPAGGNHWMRNLLLSADGKHLYVAVGSATNIADNGIEAEAGRAAIWEINLATKAKRQFAGGMRNPNGMAWNPSTGELWATVQERDLIGPDLVPDYLTNVPIGAQYGWPWAYWRNNMDRRVTAPVPAFLTEYARKPEYALGAHTSALGLVFATGGQIMGDQFANGAFVARHGSWNRRPKVGYDVVFIQFDAHGNPAGLPVPVLTGFLNNETGDARGRPVWLAWDQTKALLVSDDTGGVIWRIFAPGAKPSAAPKPVVTEHMPPQKELKGDPQFRLQITPEGDYATISQ